MVIEKMLSVLNFFNSMLPYIFVFGIIMVIIYYLVKKWSDE